MPSVEAVSVFLVALGDFGKPNINPFLYVAAEKITKFIALEGNNLPEPIASSTEILN